MKIAALAFSIAAFAALLFALVQNPSTAKPDATHVPSAPPVSANTSGEISEELPVQHVGSGINQPL